MDLKSMPNGKLTVTMIFVLLSVTFSALVHAEEVTQKFNGLTLNANLELAEGKELKDGVVMILHGLMGHNRMEIMDTAQQALLESEQSSLALNLSLGIDNRHGFYDCTKSHLHMQEDSLGEIKAWVAWLRGRGVKNITLMAHSRGANQVMVYAVEHIDPEIKLLVFLAPGTVMDSKLLFEGRFGKDFLAILDRANQLITQNRGGEIMENTDFMYCPQAPVSAQSFKSYYDDKETFRNFPSFLPRITVPALIITGTADERQPDIANHVKPYVDGKMVQLKIVEGAGHFFMDFNIEDAMEFAVQFIDEEQS